VPPQLALQGVRAVLTAAVAVVDHSGDASAAAVHGHVDGVDDEVGFAGAGQPWSASCSTSSPAVASRPDVRPSSPSSTTSRPSTTRAAGTPRSARFHLPPSRPSTPSSRSTSTLSALQPEPQAATTRCPRKRVNSNRLRSTGPRGRWLPAGGGSDGRHRPHAASTAVGHGSSGLSSRRASSRLRQGERE